MADLPPFHGDADDEPGRDAGTGGHWVKIVIVVTVVALLLMMVGLHLSGVVGSGR